MADECTESSVATSSTLPNWWDNHNHPHAPASYTFQWLHQNPHSSSFCDEDVSNHSGLTVESFNNLLGDHASDNQLWPQVLLNIGNGVELQSIKQDMGPNFLETISSKSKSTAGIFEPTACSDYLIKMDTYNNNNNNWDTFQTFNNHNGLITTHGHMLENERLLKLSNLVNTWSIALSSPESHLRHQMNEANDHFRDMTVPSHGGHEPDGAVAQAGLETGGWDMFSKSFHNQIQIGVKQFYDSTSTRNLGDYISYNELLGKPAVGINGSSNPFLKPLNLSADSKKQIHQVSSPTRVNGRGSGASSEGKKKKSEESLETSIKKSKQHNSTATSNKMQQAKVKIGDRITSLQQIVSPFGKTDTASVLTETIGYIKFLQEQVQQLSNPYMKMNSYTDPWQSLGRKETKGDGKIDLRSRGLCLVPISCTPQVYGENTGSEHWTPYRGCFYR